MAAIPRAATLTQPGSPGVRIFAALELALVVLPGGAVAESGSLALYVLAVDSLADGDFGRDAIPIVGSLIVALLLAAGGACGILTLAGVVFGRLRNGAASPLRGWQTAGLGRGLASAATIVALNAAAYGRLDLSWHANLILGLCVAAALAHLVLARSR